jgi:phosphatidylserine decarboxylase
MTPKTKLTKTCVRLNPDDYHRAKELGDGKISPVIRYALNEFFLRRERVKRIRQNIKLEDEV